MRYNSRCLFSKRSWLEVSGKNILSCQDSVKWSVKYLNFITESFRAANCFILTCHCIIRWQDSALYHRAWESHFLLSQIWGGWLVDRNSLLLYEELFHWVLMGKFNSRLHQGGYVFSYGGLVGLSSGLHKNYRTDFHKTWTLWWRTRIDPLHPGFLSLSFYLLMLRDRAFFNIINFWKE